jgi:hypothetical protein
MAMVDYCGDNGYGRLLWRQWLWLAAVVTVAPLMTYITNTR